MLSKTRSRRTLHLVSLSAVLCLSAVSLCGSAMAQSYNGYNGAIPPVDAYPGNVTSFPETPATQYQNRNYDQAPNANSRIQIAPQPTIVQVNPTAFTANQINVEGNTLISRDEVRRLVAPYEGHPLQAEQLNTLVGKINEAYRLKGYLTSIAFIPPQDLERGQITIRVLEGMVGDMEVSGNKYLKAKVVANQLREKPGDPLNIPKLEKELLRINRTEPYRLRASLLPGEHTGETKLHLDVQEQQPFQIALTTDNAGRPGIGTYRYGTELTDRNVTGHNDRFNLRYMMGTGQQIASASYALPVGSHGTEVSGLFGFSHVNVDLGSLGVHNAPELLGNAYSYGLLVSQPLDRERNWVADLGLNARRASSFYDGIQTSKDDVRSLSLGLNYDHYDRLGRTFARTQTTFAPEWLGANTHFFKLENYLTRVTRLPKNNLLLFRGYSQWTPDALPAIEQFQLGGVNSVRGYTQGLLLGDRGYSLGLEWRWPIPFLANVNPWLGERLQGALFTDFGQAWLDKKNQFYVSGVSNKHTSLLSSGIGLRAHLTDYLQGYADFAFGMLNRDSMEPNGQPFMRVHFGVRSELLSNEYKSRTDKVTPIKTNVPVHPKSIGLLQQTSGNDIQTDVADPSLEPVD